MAIYNNDKDPNENMWDSQNEKETTTTTEKYIEPIGFYGTKDKWSSDQVASSEISIFTPDKEVCTVWEIGVISATEAEANAKLISKSKELAKALQKWQNWFKREGELDTLDAADIYDESQQVLKDAGLTDK